MATSIEALVARVKQNVPQSLWGGSSCGIWRLEDVDDNGKSRKRCKVPHQVRNPGALAAVTRPTEWGTIEEAEAALPALIPFEAYIDTPNNRGIGILVRFPFFCADLDKCRNPETGELTGWAQEFLDRFPPTYSEVSISGTGLHLWYRVGTFAEWEALPNAAHPKDGHAEAYKSARYLTTTGERLDNYPTTVTEVDVATAKAIFAWVNAQGKAPEKAKLPNLNELLTRTDFPDLSPMVQRLLVLLTYKHGANRAQIEADFKTSKLYLETHWNKKWARLSETELTKAAEWVAAHPAKSEAEQKLDVILKPLFYGQGLSVRELKWYWHEYVAKGVLTVVFGPKGVGKTTILDALTAAASAAKTFPDDSPNTNPPLKILRITLEDDPETTLISRLAYMGTNLDNVGFLAYSTFVPKNGGESFTGDLAFDDDRIVAALEALIVEAKYHIIIIEPIANHAGRANMNKEQEIRQVYTRLAGVARRTDAAIIIVNHKNRRKGVGALETSMGTSGNTGVSRAVFMVDKNPDDPKETQFLNAGSNLAVKNGFKFKTEMSSEPFQFGLAEIDPENPEAPRRELFHKVWKVLHIGPAVMTADEATEHSEEEGRAERNSAGKWLAGFLKSGKKTVEEIKKACEKEAFKYDTVARAHRRAVDATSQTTITEDSRVYWALESANKELGF